MASYAQAIDPTPDTWATLAKAAGNPGALAFHQHRHRNGLSTVVQLTGDCNALVLIWMERTPNGGRELVTGLGVGECARAWVEWVRTFAAANHAESVRVHTLRPGLVRILERGGFDVVGEDDDGYTILRMPIYGW